MSVFDRLDRLTSRAADRVYARVYVCRPMTATANGRAAPDTARPAWEATGIYDEEPAFHAIEAESRNRSGNDFRTLATGQSHELSVDRTRYPAASTTRQGDQIELGERKFTVAEVQADGMGRIIFGLLER